MQWQPRSTIGPPPACAASQNHALCGPGVRLARARPHHLTDLAGLDRFQRLQRLRRVDEILEIAGEDAGALDGVEHPFRLLRAPCERLRAQHRFSVLRAEVDRLLVELVRQADHDRVGVRMRDGPLEVGRPLRDVVLGAEGSRPLLGARVDEVHAIAVALPVERHRVEEADQAGPEHRHLVTFHAVASCS